jgi:tetratricopeptide (TPR) repeat protein
MACFKSMVQTIQASPRNVSMPWNKVPFNSMYRGVISVALILAIPLSGWILSSAAASLPVGEITQEGEQPTAREYLNKGFQSERQGNFRGAIAHYSEAIKLNPKLMTAYYSRGLLWMNLRDYRKALADFTITLQLDPKRAPAYYQRGIAHTRMGNKSHAKVDFQKAVQLYQQRKDNFSADKSRAELKKLTD